MRDLKSIEEEFVILNRYKDMLNKEKETTKDEENLSRIDKDINAVNELMKELQIEVNEWANNYNKKDEEQIIEKTTREKFEENKKKIQDIKNQSKALQPKISGVDKTIKKQILISNGFIETETVDYRKILIHPSLVGKYYDLVKEQRILSKLLYEEYMKSMYEQEELISEPEEIAITSENNNDNNLEEKIELISESVATTSENNNDDNQDEQIEKSLDERIKEIQDKIDYILNKARGKKILLKYKGEKYYIPKYERGKFLAYMRELNKLKKQKNESFNIIEVDNNELPGNIIRKIDINDIPEIIEPEHTEIATIKDNYIEGTNILKPRDRNPYETDEEYNNYLTEYYKQYYNDTFKNPDYNEEKTEIKDRIKNVRKPKFKDKIKKIFKRAKIIVLAAILAIATKVTMNLYKNNSNIKKDIAIEATQAPDEELENELDGIEDQQDNNYESQDEEIKQEIDIDAITKEVEEEKTIEEDKSIEEDIDEFDKDNFKIGEKVTIVPGSKIYISEDRAMNEREEDMQNPYYKNSDDKRVVLGVAISKDNKLYQICACTQNCEEKIQSLLNDGGKIESVLTGNVDRVEKLKQYDGKYMSAEDINRLAEGWYNVNSIIKNNERGRTR